MNIFFLKIGCFIFLIYLLFTSSIVFAQFTTSEEYEIDYSKKIPTLVKKEDYYFKFDDYKKNDVDFYFSPLKIIEPRPTLCLGIEYFIKNTISIYTDLGYIFNLTGRQLIDSTTNWQNWSTNGSIGSTILNSSTLNYVINSEIRWYKNKKNPQDAFYYALKLMWRNTNYLKSQIISEQYSYSTLTNNWTGIGTESIENYGVKRNSIGLQFIIGQKHDVFKKGIGNIYGGVGLRYIANKPLQKSFNPFDFGNQRAENLDLEFLDFSKQYKVITIDFSLGIRFGGKIKR